MKNINYFLTFLALNSALNSFAQTLKPEQIRLHSLAKQVTITRDNWGIAHIFGKTDADAVFGMLYAQCEDDFQRIEMNYIEKLGRLSEIKGEKHVYNDLENRLLLKEADAKKDYKNAPLWLKKLLNAFADGINFYLLQNPQVKPQLLTKFEPHLPLIWTDGSIGAISTADLSTSELISVYRNDKKVAYNHRVIDEFTGSNGFAIAPSKSVSGNALLYINPHTTFYFRPEIHVQSQEGLNAYGAVTWGQFFIYQGFNQNCGWMHTSSNIDVADMYAEEITFVKKPTYKYDNKNLSLSQNRIEIKFRKNDSILSQTFNTFETNHGPIMAKRNGRFIALKHYNRSMKSLIESWQRTKSKTFEDYKSAMNIKANTSNNTVYADNQGNIAYWHGNFVPRRDPKFDYAKVLDGTTSTTDWNGLHDISETVHLYNPKNGWLQNCNSTPFSMAGLNSPKKENYPSYMAPDGENYRATNAVRLLSENKKYTLETLIKDGYDSKLSIFEVLIPALTKCFDENIKPEDKLYVELKEPIETLRNWNFYGAENSVATTLANDWAFELDKIIQKTYIDQGEKDQIENVNNFAKSAKPEQLLPQLQKVIQRLTKDFGMWQVPWGDINRFQRLSGDIDLKFDDSKPSLSNAYGSVLCGSLPAFRSNYHSNTKKRYGYNGNSFVCAVEFGKKIRAKTLLAGGNSGNPASKHFLDQAENYKNGIFKDVHFYKEDIMKNAIKTYHPGE
jgi:acyl-homoserine lactone acylase PvdQ